MYDIIFRIQNGEKDLLEQFIIDNMEYIYSITKKYYNLFDDYEDLAQEAIIGFVKAVYNYNDKLDFYKQYAILWINNYIKRYILDNINLISDIDKRYFFAMDIYDRCKNKYKHEPTK